MFKKIWNELSQLIIFYKILFEVFALITEKNKANQNLMRGLITVLLTSKNTYFLKINKGSLGFANFSLFYHHVAYGQQSQVALSF